MAAPCRTIISQFDPDNLDSMKGDCLVDPTYRHHTYGIGPSGKLGYAYTCI